MEISEESNNEYQRINSSNSSNSPNSQKLKEYQALHYPIKAKFLILFELVSSNYVYIYIYIYSAYHGNKA